MVCEVPSQIVGLLHEISMRSSIKNLTLHLTLPLCNHPLYVPTTGTAPIILSNHVKMHSPEAGAMIVTVEPCGLILPTDAPLKRLWRKLIKKRGGGLTVVALVPARTDTAWWHDSCIMHEVRFIRGRLKFGNSKNSAPFPSAVIVMRS